MTLTSPPNEAIRTLWEATGVPLHVRELTRLLGNLEFARLNLDG